MDPLIFREPGRLLMRIPVMRSVLVLAALALTGCTDGDFGPSDRFQTDFHYTWDLQPGGRIAVESFNGNVEITGWDENKVEIRGVKYGSSEELRDRVKIEEHHSSSSVDIRAIRPSAHFGNSGARFLIHVPRTAIVDRVSTSNSTIRVTGVAGAAHLKTSNSSIRVENVGGDVEARTSNSSIDVDSVRGALMLRSSNGPIRANNVEGPVDVGTSNSGIELEFRTPPRSDVMAKTDNGGITLRLPANANARVDADTSNSSIHSDFDLVGSMDEEKRHARGTIGSGGPLLRLDTSNGNIRLAKGGMSGRSEE